MLINHHQHGLTTPTGMKTHIIARKKVTKFPQEMAPRLRIRRLNTAGDELRSQLGLSRCMRQPQFKTETRTIEQTGNSESSAPNGARDWE